eukprot:IDg16390t1
MLEAYCEPRAACVQVAAGTGTLAARAPSEFCVCVGRRKRASVRARGRAGERSLHRKYLFADLKLWLGLLAYLNRTTWLSTLRPLISSAVSYQIAISTKFAPPSTHSRAVARACLIPLSYLILHNLCC